MSRCVIVGGGQAAAQTAIALRQHGFAGSVRIVGEEPLLPYQRPPLTKRYLAGQIGADRLEWRPQALYEKLDVRVDTGVKVVHLDGGERRLWLSDGSTADYDRLVLATGARPRALAVPGTNDEGLVTLRTVRDVDRIRPKLVAGARLVIIGGGYIGLELAAVAATQGVTVTVLEAATNVLARVTGTEVAGFLSTLHRRQGVDIVTGARVARVDTPTGVECADGRSYAGDLIVVAVGVEPNVELARAAGLACDDGIAVDEHGRTSDPAIYAAGDSTRHPNPLLGRRLRLESVHNAIEQARTVAAHIAGAPRPYAQMPWFWSDQYDVKLQTVGIATGHDQAIVRGDPDAGSFSVLYVAEGHVVALDAVNAPGEFSRARLALAAGPLPLDDWPGCRPREASAVA